MRRFVYDARATRQEQASIRRFCGIMKMPPQLKLKMKSNIKKGNSCDKAFVMFLVLEGNEGTLQ